MKDNKSRIVETIVDSIYDSNDSEIVQESEELYGDLDLRLSAALKSINETIDSFETKSQSIKFPSAAELLKKNLGEKKFTLVQIFQARPELTAQFRDFEDLSENDVDFLIEDLRELGVLK